MISHCWRVSCWARCASKLSRQCKASRGECGGKLHCNLPGGCTVGVVGRKKWHEKENRMFSLIHGPRDTLVPNALVRTGEVKSSAVGPYVPHKTSSLPLSLWRTCVVISRPCNQSICLSWGLRTRFMKEVTLAFLLLKYKQTESLRCGRKALRVNRPHNILPSCLSFTHRLREHSSDKYWFSLHFCIESNLNCIINRPSESNIKKF